MDKKCIKCLQNENAETCHDIAPEFLIYTDLTADEIRADVARGVIRQGGAPAQRARCMAKMMGVNRILAIARVMEKQK